MVNYNNNTFFVDPEEDRQSRAKVDKLIWILILIGATLIPLLIGGATFPFVSPVITESVTIQTGAKGDFFTYYKVMALTTISVLILLLLIYKTLFIGYRVSTTWVNYLLFGSALVVMMSTYLSPFSNIALWGMYNRFDGAMTTIFYILLVFALINIHIPKSNYIYLVYSQIPFVLVNFGMSVLYFLNKDLLNYPAFNTLMSLFLKEGDSLESTTRMMGTLNQINYMSGTFGAMALLFLVWAVVETKVRHRVVALVMSLLSFAIVLMATSFSGFFTLVAGGFIAIVLLFVAGYRKQLAMYGTGFATVAVALLLILSIQNPRIFDETFGYFTDWNPFVKEEQSSEYLFSSRVHAAESLELPDIPEAGMSAGTGRLYIWKGTLDALMERPIFGYGMDTLPYGFNQEDINKIAGMTRYEAVIDKPHNLYLGFLYGVGIPGGLAIIALLLLPIALLVRRLMKKQSVEPIIYILTAFYIGYLLQGIANDNVVGNALFPMVTLGFLLHWHLRQSEEHPDGGATS